MTDQNESGELTPAARAALEAGIESAKTEPLRYLGSFADGECLTLLTCGQCGGNVSPMTGHGRTRTYHVGSPPMPIPDDFPIHTCARCGETYILPELAPKLNERLREAFLAWGAETKTQVEWQQEANAYAQSKVGCSALIAWHIISNTGKLRGQDAAFAGALERLLELSGVDTADAAEWLSNEL